MKPLLLLLTICLSAIAQASPQEVAKGSDLRAYLFDLARTGVEQEAGRPVKFQGSLKQLDGWAFFNGSIVDESGRKVMAGDAESADTVILWKKAGQNWRVVAYIVGMTDVGYANWADKYGAPEALFP